MKIRTPDQLTMVREWYSTRLEQQQMRVLVCSGTGCIAGGSLDVYRQLRDLAEKAGLIVEVSLAAEEPGESCPAAGADASDDTCRPALVGLKKSGCHGFCELGPLVRIEPQGLALHQGPA